MKIEYEAIRARLSEALADALRVHEADKGSPSQGFDSGRYDGLKQAIEILDEEAKREGYHA